MKTVGASPTPPVCEHARGRRVFLEASSSASQPTNLCQTRQAAAHERSVRNRKRENPPQGSRGARSENPHGQHSTCERGGAAAAALRGSSSSRFRRVPQGICGFRGRISRGLVFWWTRRWWGSRGRGKNWSRWSTASPTSPFPAPPPRAADWLVVELVFVHFFYPF